MRAIFQSTSQALHVSFLVMSLPARQDVGTRKALIEMMRSADELDQHQMEWLHELIGAGTGSVNFTGLSSYEIRAQCAMVTQAVKSRLPGPERFAVWVRYGIQTERAEGVQGLADYVRPQLSFGDDIAIKALVYGHSVPGMRMKGLSYPEIAKERDINPRALRRAAGVIASTCRTLEEMACERLRPIFEREGVIEPQETEARVCAAA